MSADTTIPNSNVSQSFNRYMFCAGNPLSFVDVSGHNWLSKGWNGICKATRCVIDTVTSGKSISGSINITKDVNALFGTIGDAGKAIGNAIAHPDWKKIGYMAAGALIAGGTAFMIAGVVAGLMTLSPIAIPLAVIYQASIAGSIGFGAGLIGGYSAADNDEDFGSFCRGSAMMGTAIGSNIVTSSVYGLYLARVALFYPVAYYMYKRGNIKSYDSVLDIGLGKDYDINGGHHLRARPWMPGDPHTFGQDRDKGKNWYDFKDWHAAYAMLDILGGHGLSVVHDYDSEPPRSHDPYSNWFQTTVASATGTEWLYY